MPRKPLAREWPPQVDCPESARQGVKRLAGATAGSLRGRRLAGKRTVEYRTDAGR